MKADAPERAAYGRTNEELADWLDHPLLAHQTHPYNEWVTTITVIRDRLRADGEEFRALREENARLRAMIEGGVRGWASIGKYRASHWCHYNAFTTDAPPPRDTDEWAPATLILHTEEGTE